VTDAPLYVYGIARRGRSELGRLRGLGNAPVERVSVGDVEAIVSRLSAGVPEADEATVVRHDAVCTALMSEGPLAPARFGSVFRDEAGVRREVETRRSELEALLDRLEGRVELGVRVLRTRSQAAGGPVSSGSDYLRTRLEERRAALDAATEIHEQLEQHAVSSRTRMLETPEVFMSAGYLVESDGVGAFRAAVEELDDQRADVAIVCTGPWPAYSFADGDE
jgi:Gas vesicle synthesis protein GvpL/GvpF